EFPRLAVEAIADRPRAAAGRLQHEIQTATAAVWNLPALRGRLQILNRFHCEGLCHLRYPDLPEGNKNPRLGLLPRVRTLADRIVTSPEKSGISTGPLSVCAGFCRLLTPTASTCATA